MNPKMWAVNTLASLLFAAICIPGHVKSAEVYVNWNTGNDTECTSLQDLQILTAGGEAVNQTQTPCRTINRALGNLECTASCDNESPLYDSVLKLSNGEHTLEGCIAILMGENITIEAENQGEATIKCTRFGNTDTYDHIISCETRGLVFSGINFEGCGPLSSNVFINRSTDVLFEDCVFR